MVYEGLPIGFVYTTNICKKLLVQEVTGPCYRA